MNPTGVAACLSVLAAVILATIAALLLRDGGSDQDEDEPWTPAGEPPVLGLTEGDIALIQLTGAYAPRFAPDERVQLNTRQVSGLEYAALVRYYGTRDLTDEEAAKVRNAVVSVPDDVLADQFARHLGTPIDGEVVAVEDAVYDGRVTHSCGDGCQPPHEVTP